jgi:hypothetical protein
MTRRSKAPPCVPVKLTRAKLAAIEPPPQYIPDNLCVSFLSSLLARIEMLRHDIMPCGPEGDLGTDVVSQHHSVLKRVQIKGQATDGKSPDTFTFSTCRNDAGGKRPYRLDELDAFVFVHTGCERFFVVPAAPIIKSGRYTITFGPNSHSQWENAWWVLKKN